MAVVALLAFTAGCTTARGQEEAAPEVRGALSPEGVTVDPLIAEGEAPPPVWAPAAPQQETTRPYRCRIVSYADKWTRHGFSNYMWWRHPNGPVGERAPDSELYSLTHDLDVDGDGRTEDDYVASLVFSLTEPLSIPDWPMAMAFPERRSSRFYGGVSWYVSNSTPEQSRFWVEQGYNPDHSPPFYDARAEDHPLQGQANEKVVDSFHRHYWAIVWKKDDFLNDGDRYRVTFDETSRLASMCTRNYWLGYDDVRMIVQDGEQLYISDTEQFDIPTKGYAPMRGRVFLLYPTVATWAEYEPRDHFIHFDHARARFARHEFTDVRAVGWYLAKDRLQGKQSHIKWYGFEADAVVHRPAQGSVNIDMVKVPATEGVPEFYAATCELPYLVWRDIHRYGDSPFHTLEARYVYRKDGDMGSMLFGERPHGPDEPATNFTWYDALAICNTLSEMEGKEPCYYVDAEFNEVFRNVHVATHAVGPDYTERNLKNPTYEEVPEPVVHVKWDASGHRLPTVAEWRAAAGNAGPGWVAQNSEGTTHPVGRSKPNERGLYDAIGNVWELVWTHGDAFDPEQADAQVALGGDFHHPHDPTSASAAASPYGDEPYDGGHNIGLRLVCREKGLGRPAMGAAPGQPGYSADPVPAWSFRRDERTAARTEEAEPETPVLDMAALEGGQFVRFPERNTITVAPLDVAKYPTTYAQWKRVLQWAEANGYTFSKTGDMGSMYWYAFTHRPDEPVVQLTWHDMLVWCNALSEMEGRTPCYYEDEECTEVYRSAFTYRALKVDGPELVAAEPHRYAEYSAYAQPWLFVRWDTDGYRLPTEAEFEYALRGGTQTNYFWGTDDAKKDDYTWNILNAGGRTHPVGQKQPNPFGLYDVQGNVYQWLFSRYRTRIPGRPPELDTNNPKQNPYLSWRQPKELYSPPGAGMLVAGGSFLYGNFNVNGQHGVTVDSQNSVNALCYYPDVGFRVVRCEAGTHPRDGLEPLAEWPTVIEIDPADYDPLQGAAWRGNLLRAGTFETRGVRRLKGPKWKFETGGPVESSPVVTGGVLYVGSHDGFYALDAGTGEQKWKVDVRGGVKSSACVAGGTAFFGGNDGKLCAVDAAGGEVRWTAQGNEALTTSPAVAYGVVFVEGAWGFDPETGKQVWTTSRGRLRGQGDARRSSLLVAPGGVLYQNGSPCDIVTARFTSGDGDTWASQNTEALWEDMFFTTNSGVGGAVNLPTLVATDLETGRKKWSREIVLPGQSVAERKVVLCSPAVWNNKVYIGFDGGALFAFDALRGSDLWTFKARDAIRSSPSISAEDGVLYVGSHDGNVYGLDAETGEELWRFKTGGKVTSSACVADGVVFIGSEDGTIYALEGE